MVYNQILTGILSLFILYALIKIFRKMRETSSDLDGIIVKFFEKNSILKGLFLFVSFLIAAIYVTNYITRFFPPIDQSANLILGIVSAEITMFLVGITAYYARETHNLVKITDEYVNETHNLVKITEDYANITQDMLTQSKKEQRIKDIEYQLEKFYIPAFDILDDQSRNMYKFIVLGYTVPIGKGSMSSSKTLIGLIDLNKYHYLAKPEISKQFDEYIKEYFKDTYEMDNNTTDPTNKQAKNKLCQSIKNEIDDLKRELNDLKTTEMQVRADQKSQ